jgi:aquaporin Z
MLALIMIIYSWGLISGANVNPAISIAMACDGRISCGKMVGYWVFQFLGAILAAYVLLYIFGPDSTLGSSIGSLTYTEPWKAAVVEAFLTFFLVYIVLSIKSSHIAGIAIGITLGMGVLFGYLLTGGSLNPARSFGPALVSGNLENIWIYFVGPIIGALVAYAVYILFKPGNEKLMVVS